MPIYNSAYSMLRIQHFSQLHFLFPFKNRLLKESPPRQLFGSFKIKFTEIIDINIRLKIWELSPPPFFPTHLHTTNLDFKNCQLWGVFFLFCLGQDFGLVCSFRSKTMLSAPAESCTAPSIHVYPKTPGQISKKFHDALEEKKNTQRCTVTSRQRANTTTVYAHNKPLHNDNITPLCC